MREKSRSADLTPVLHFRDLRFCCRKSGCARRSSIFPRTSAKHGSTERPEAKTATKSAGNSPLNAKTAFRRFPRTKPDVPSQGLITTRTLRKSPIPINHYSDKGQPWGAKPKYLRTSGTSRMSLIRVLAVIDCCDTPFSQREAVGFETPNSDSNSC